MPERLPDLESLVSFRFSIVAKLWDRRLADLVNQSFGLSVAEYRVLAQLGLHPGSTVRTLSTRTLMDKAQVSRTITDLEDADLVARSVSQTDRRSPEFVLTGPGEQLLEQIVPVRLAQEQELLSRLEPSVAEALSVALDVLAAELDIEKVPRGIGTKDRRRAARQRLFG